MPQAQRVRAALVHLVSKVHQVPNTSKPQIEKPMDITSCGNPLGIRWNHMSSCGKKTINIPMGIMWTYCGHIVEILWTYCGNTVEIVSNPTGTQWRTYGSPMESQWKSYRNPKDILWNSYGHPMDMNYVRRSCRKSPE